MDEILVKIVAYKPEERWASAAALKRALEEQEKRLISGPEAGGFSCASCGGAVRENDAFCARCGAASPVRAAQPAPLRLTVVDGGADQ